MVMIKELILLFLDNNKIQYEEVAHLTIFMLDGERCVYDDCQKTVFYKGKWQYFQNIM
jgi:hypothetical protein